MKVASPPRAPAREPLIEPEVAGAIAGGLVGTAVSLGVGALLYVTGQVEPVVSVLATAGTAWFVTPATAALGALLAGARAAERGP